MDANSIYWIGVLEVLHTFALLGTWIAGTVWVFLAFLYFGMGMETGKPPFSLKPIILCGFLFVLLILVYIFVPTSQTYATMVLTNSVQQGKKVDEATLKPLLESWVRSITHDYSYLLKKDKED